MPIVLDGRALADKICLDLQQRIDKLKTICSPKLTIVTTGDDSASKVYVRNKVRRAEEIGIDVTVKHFDRLDIKDQSEVMSIPGPIIYQMPMTGNVTLTDLSGWVSPWHDVDGFVATDNVAGLASGSYYWHAPCTPAGIMRLLDEYDIDLEHQVVCIIGRSNIVGRPLARMMEHAGATVTLCHSKTPRWFLDESIAMADIVVSATGQRNMIDESFEIHGVCDKVLIDVGINRDENGKLCGDINPLLFDCCKAYTPVPGGVGPMTVAMLMENVICYYEQLAESKT